MLKQKSMRIWICKNCGSNIHGSIQKLENVEYEPGIEVVGIFCDPICEEDYKLKIGIMNYISNKCTPSFKSLPLPWVWNKYEWQADDESGVCYSIINSKAFFDIEAVHVKTLGKIKIGIRQRNFDLDKLKSFITDELKSPLEMNNTWNESFASLFYRSFNWYSPSELLSQILEVPVNIDNLPDFKTAQIKAADIQQKLATILANECETECKEAKEYQLTAQEIYKHLNLLG